MNVWAYVLFDFEPKQGLKTKPDMKNKVCQKPSSLIGWVCGLINYHKQIRSVINLTNSEH